MNNPILMSSTRNRMRSIRTPLIVTFYCALLLIMAFYAQLRPLSASNLYIAGMRNCIDGYIYLTCMQFLLIVMVAPALTAGSISGERERQTFDLLLVTNTSSAQIVLGKLFESFMFMALLILSSAPVMAVVLLGGGITLLQLATTMLFLLTTALGALAVGLFCSALFKRTITATVAAYLLVFAIGIGTLAPLAFGATSELSSYVNDYELLVTLTPERILNMLPKLIFVNPALGLVSLIADQTELLKRTLSSMLPMGYVMYPLLKQFSFGTVAYINMALVTVSALILTLISGLLLRPVSLRTPHMRGKRRKGKA